MPWWELNSFLSPWHNSTHNIIEIKHQRSWSASAFLRQFTLKSKSKWKLYLSLQWLYLRECCVVLGATKGHVYRLLITNCPRSINCSLQLWVSGYIDQGSSKTIAPLLEPRSFTALTIVFFHDVIMIAVALVRVGSHWSGNFISYNWTQEKKWSKSAWRSWNSRVFSEILIATLYDSRL